MRAGINSTGTTGLERPTPNRAESPSWVDGGPLEVDSTAPQTLPEALLRAARSAADIVTIDASGAASQTSYAQFLIQARKVAGALRAARIGVGDKILLQLDDPGRFLPSLWGCLLIGATPAPFAVAPTLEAGQIASERLTRVWNLMGRPALLTDSAQSGALRRWGDRQPQSPRTLIYEDLAVAGPIERDHAPGGDDAALLLFTSGSSGVPKGVSLSHRNLLAMAAGTAAANSLGSKDVTLNWLKLDHVGAIAFLHVLPVFLASCQVHVATPYILEAPLRWLDLLARHRVSVSWAPNFAFDLINQRLEKTDSAGWDLSRVRMLVSAGEPIRPSVLNRFWRRLAAFGLSPRAICPAFGMTECASGITWSHSLDLSQISPSAQTVDLGLPIPGAALRVVDALGHVVPMGEIGRLQIRGPSLAQGYLDEEGLAPVTDSDGWFSTGDLGRLRAGQLQITGREKHVIIVRGVHYSGDEIERAAERVEGVVPGQTVACETSLPASGEPGLAVFYVTGDSALGTRIADEVRRAVRERVGAAPNVVVPLRADQLPKTSIGKIDRQALKRQFEAGELLPRANSALDHSAHSTPTSNRPAPDAQHLGESIALIWRRLLARDEVGLDDHFFDLGGDSVLLVEMQQELASRLQVDISVVDLLGCATIRGICEHVRSPSGAPKSSEVDAHRRARVEWTAATGAESANPLSSAIAVIGMACRAPGARNPVELWRNLSSGVESIDTLSETELLRNGVSIEERTSQGFVNRVGWLNAVENFDAEFFGFSAAEAARLDPQHRQFLECAYEALEDAALRPRAAEQRVGVFAASGVNLYERQIGAQPDLAGSFEQSLVAGAVDFLATRVSYKLDLRGPSLTVQTACSSSLVCVHLACQSLQAQECDVALAGGVSLWTLERRGYRHRPGELTSPTGRCRAFSADADGMIFSNGTGVVVLKPLGRALADRDPIYAVIRGSAVNNDGGNKASFMATGAQGQADVIAAALHRAQVRPEDIGYVECHGTGTVLGDAVEYSGLTKVFGAAAARRSPRWVGSVKNNIGHLGVACGVVGLIKTVLAVQHGQLPPVLHFERPNPHLDFARGPFQVNRSLEPWPQQGVRRAGVSSFGLGGTNAHVIIESAPESIVAQPPEATPELLLISARSAAGLQAACGRLRTQLRTEQNLALVDVAHTLALGRREFAFRRSIVTSDTESACRQLGRPESHPSPARASSYSMVLGPDADLTEVQWQTLLAGDPKVRAAYSEACETAGGLADAAAAVKMPVDNLPAEFFAFARAYAMGSRVFECAGRPAQVLGLGLGKHAMAALTGALPLRQSVLEVLREIGAVREIQGDDATSQWLGTSAAPTTMQPSAPSPVFQPGESADAVSAGLAFLAAAEEPVVVLDARLRIASQPSMAARSEPKLIFLQSPAAATADAVALLRAMCGSLWERGISLDWAKLSGERRARKLHLPTYPFAPQRHWIERPTVVDGEKRSRATGRETPASGPTVRANRGRLWTNRASGWLVQALRQQPTEAQAPFLKDQVRLLLREMLRLPPEAAIDQDCGFLELGLTSLDALELVGVLESALDIALPATLLLEHPTLRKLSAHFLETESAPFSVSRSEEVPG